MPVSTCYRQAWVKSAAYGRPKLTYDDKKGKLMIYYTMRFKNEANKLYYVYVNDDFDRIETLPQILYEYPNEKISAIDGDITKVGDRYRMFYVSHDGGAGNQTGRVRPNQR